MLQHHLEEGRLPFDLLEQALPLGLGPAAVGEVVHEQAPALVHELERPCLLVQQLLGQAAVQATRRSGGGRSPPGCDNRACDCASRWSAAASFSGLELATAGLLCD